MATPLRPFLAQVCPQLALIGRFSHVLNTFYHAVGDAFAPLLAHQIYPVLTVVGRFSHVLITFYHAVGDASAPLLGPSLPRLDPHRAHLTRFQHVLPRSWRRVCTPFWPNSAPSWHSSRASHTFGARFRTPLVTPFARVLGPSLPRLDSRRALLTRFDSSRQS